jgi:hypothetical protein
VLNSDTDLSLMIVKGHIMDLAEIKKAVGVKILLLLAIK